MCSIFGVLTTDINDEEALEKVNQIVTHIASKSVSRGRDGFGVFIENVVTREPLLYRQAARIRSVKGDFVTSMDNMVIIGNCRAEPTTEYVKEKTKSDQQPYMCGKWVIVHNGTIANDKELRTYKLPTKIDSAAIAEQLDKLSQTNNNNAEVFHDVIHSLKGSFAILAVHVDSPNVLFGAANYRPIWYATSNYGIFFASNRRFFPEYLTPSLVAPYSTFIAYSDDCIVDSYPMRGRGLNNRALVVCSGGLDSVVAATTIQKKGFEIELLHFRYGSRAQGQEARAVWDVAKALSVPLTTLPIPIYGKSDSPLLDTNSPLAGGEAGAEFAHEWVPARNLVMLSIATAYAEANGFDVIVLGNNMEEAGAYPDNEPEFVEHFNDLLPFAIGANKKIGVLMPVGNLMKHEIVKLGHKIGAPMHLTWSCYRSGKKHCGKCGPCYMRRKAFEINNINETIEYEE